jgi:hypothetical protein
MNGRIAKILICVLCGAFLLIAGCTTAAPSGEAATTPTARATQAPVTGSDLGTVIGLLQTITGQLTVIEENTQPVLKGIVTGNIILFDDQGDPANAIAYGSSMIALPQGTCDVAVYASQVKEYITLEEMKDYSSTKYSRNSQACADVYLCRKTVTLDKDFSYLYVTYKPYVSTNRLAQVSLSYWCKSY